MALELNHLLKIVLLLPLIAIVREDFQQRSVHILWLLSFAIIGLFFSIEKNGWWQIKDWGLINGGFIIFQLLLLTIYFSIRNRCWVNITNQYLGWGDILFFIGIIFLMPPLTFIWFYTLSLIVILIGFLLIKQFHRTIKTIPLAGGMAICLLVFFIFNET